MEEVKPKRRLVRTHEAASYLNISIWAVRQLIADGVLDPVRIRGGGRAFLIDLRDLDEIVDRAKTLRE